MKVKPCKQVMDKKLSNLNVNINKTASEYVTKTVYTLTSSCASPVAPSVLSSSSSSDVSSPDVSSCTGVGVTPVKNIKKVYTNLDTLLLRNTKFDKFPRFR